MSALERTVQQVDPLGAIPIRPLTAFSAIVAVIYAAVRTVLDRSEIVHPWAAGAAFVALAFAVTLAVIATSPLRAPFPRRVFVMIAGAMIVAMVLAAVSTWGMNDSLRFDWSTNAFGLMIVALSSFRPPRELVASGVIAGIVGAVLAVAQAPFTAVQEPVAVTVAISITPLLALPFAAAAFAHVMVSSVERWQSEATIAVAARSDDARVSITRSVRQDRVTILNRDVVPFFADVIARGAITDDDRARATAISDAVRSIMVAEVDRSWLDVVVDHAMSARQPGASGEASGSESVQDDDRLAARMNADQRTALRATVSALFTHPQFDPSGFCIVIVQHGSEAELTLRARIDAGENFVRSELAPYLSVLGVVFGGLRTDVDHPAITLRLNYDCK